MLVLAAIILIFFHAYMGRGQVGAGDIEHYAIQLADFVTQVQRGEFPVWTGQSEFAFNGNVHTLRTAPYHVHFGGLLYALTGGLAGFAGTVNLEILLSALAGALVVYRLAIHYREDDRWCAAFWALIYVLAPATWLVIATRDMLTTYLAIPWLPLIWHGWARFIDRDAPSHAPVAAIGGTALLWWIHPPIAAWMSALGTLIFIGGAMLYPDRLRKVWPAVLTVGLAGLSVAAYPILSVRSLELSYSLTNPSAAILANLTSQNLDALRSFSTVPLGDTPPLQPGWALWLIWISALFSWPRLGRGPKVLMGATLALGLLLLPWPAVTGTIWRHLPPALLDATNVWPQQRFYPIIAAAVVVVGVRLVAGSIQAPRRRKIVFLSLAVCVLWSAWEARVLLRRTTATQSTAEATKLAMAPENIKLGRSSYALFGTTPQYVSHGYMEPAFAFRLIGAKARSISAPNTEWLANQSNETLSQPADGLSKFTANPGRAYLLSFQFPNDSPGEVAIEGPGIRRNFGLPVSGGPTAFGSLPGTIRTIPFLSIKDTPVDYRVSSTVPGVRFTVNSAEAALLPIRIHGLTPLRATLNLENGGMLATPVMWIPGYVATVNGTTARIQRGPTGLLQIRVPGGTSEFELRYIGPPGLGLSYYAAILAMLIIASSAFSARKLLSEGGSKRWHLWAAGGVMVATGLGAAQLEKDHGSRQLPVIRTGQGPVELRIDMIGMDRESSQPLLEFGKSGAADLLYLAFDEDGQARIGIDHWGYGGPESDALLEENQAVHTLRLESPALCGGSDIGPWIVTWDGEVVLSAELPAYPDEDGIVQIGQNTVGASTTVPELSGLVLSVRQGKLLHEPSSEEP